MGGGCSTKRSIITNDASAKVNLKKLRQDQDAAESDADRLNVDRKSECLPLIIWIELNKQDEKKLGKLMKKQISPDDFEESVEDLNNFDKKVGIKSDKEWVPPSEWQKQDFSVMNFLKIFEFNNEVMFL